MEVVERMTIPIMRRYPSFGPWVRLALILTLMGLVPLIQGKEGGGLFGSSEPSKISSPLSSGQNGECFCQLHGQIDDCQCDVDTVDHFNNEKIFPRLQSLLQKPYFRYFQYRDNKPCPFWNISEGKCASSNCVVKSCQPDEIPPGLKGDIPSVIPHDKYSAEANEPSAVKEDCVVASDAAEEAAIVSDKVDGTISQATRDNLRKWQAHHDSQSPFCDVDEDRCQECVYVDLTLNPERFTGYSGKDAHRIWKTIYEENCFRPDTLPVSGRGTFSAAFLQHTLSDLCLEKRAFYRAISGLHSSISIHLCANYLMKTSDSPFITPKDQWGPNLDEFQRRFDPELTNNQGPYWLRNLYFVYLLELRALTKVAPYLEQQTFYTGKEEEDKETQIAVKELLNLLRSFPDHFDETKLFSQGVVSKDLKREFQTHFRNISRVMDCVGCDKCRLWGKLQITGLGTALKILFFEDHSGKLKNRDWEAVKRDLQEMKPPPVSGLGTSPLGIDTVTDFRLSRNEIVSLFNAFGRISTSIQQLERFREMMK